MPAFCGVFIRTVCGARRFVLARRGNVAIIFALSLIPILGLTGAAIDFGRANAVKASLQAALDSTALMVSKTAASQTGSQIQTSTQSYFLAMFQRPEVNNIQITSAYSNDRGSSVLVTGSADMPTEFMGIFGFKKITVAGMSAAKWGSSRLRVALVLDTTGSMAADGKIDALKTATKNLLTQLHNAAGIDGDVYVSIIPFSKNMNLGAGNFRANWIDWTDWDSEPAILKTSKPNNWDQIGPGSSCPFSSSNYGFGCTRDPANNSQATSTIPSSGSYSGYICPGVDGGNKNSLKIGLYYNGCYTSVPTTTTTQRTIDTGKKASCGNISDCACSGNGKSTVCTQTTTTTGAPYTHTWLKNDHSTWNGCVADRGMSTGPSSDYDRLVTSPSTSITATLFPAEQNSYCSPPVSGLSYNWSSMATQINSLYPLGATNQPIGLVWGWQSLAGGGPLSAPAKESSYTYFDVIILLSDGLNTQDRWFGNGSSTNTSVDYRMYDQSGFGTCANINAAKISVYAIQVNTGGDPTSTLLKNCAGTGDPSKFPDPSKFFLLTSATQIITTFDAIGTNLTKLRIAQ